MIFTRKDRGAVTTGKAIKDQSVDMPGMGLSTHLLTTALLCFHTSHPEALQLATCRTPVFRILRIALLGTSNCYLHIPPGTMHHIQSSQLHFLFWISPQQFAPKIVFLSLFLFTICAYFPTDKLPFCWATISQWFLSSMPFICTILSNTVYSLYWNGENRFFQNSNTNLPNYMVSHPSRP